MSISAKAMSITGIDDRRYWTWVPTEESRLVSNLQRLRVSFVPQNGVRTWSMELETLKKSCLC